MVYGILDAATGEFRYVSAGHPGPVHLPSGADPVILESQGSPIGLADDPYEERWVRLGAGDRLYLYSDGVPEAMDPAGKQFGDARLLEAIGQGRSESLQESVADAPRGDHAVEWIPETSRRYLDPRGRGLGAGRAWASPAMNPQCDRVPLQAHSEPLPGSQEERSSRTSGRGLGWSAAIRFRTSTHYRKKITIIFLYFLSRDG